MMSGLSGKIGTSWKYIAHGNVIVKAINHIPKIMPLARFFDICIFKGHQIAKNLSMIEEKKNSQLD